MDYIVLWSCSEVINLSLYGSLSADQREPSHLYLTRAAAARLHGQNNQVCKNTIHCKRDLMLPRCFSLEKTRLHPSFLAYPIPFHPSYLNRYKVSHRVDYTTPFSRTLVKQFSPLRSLFFSSTLPVSSSLPTSDMSPSCAFVQG